MRSLLMENVNFADNYYQSVSNPDNQALPAADFNIAMGSVEIVQSRAVFAGTDSENSEGTTTYC
jgi:hypothetical protein